jgi:transcriptional regulator with GAF, ATPase, and Fis domain
MLDARGFVVGATPAARELLLGPGSSPFGRPVEDCFDNGPVAMTPITGLLGRDVGASASVRGAKVRRADREAFVDLDARVLGDDRATWAAAFEVPAERCQILITVVDATARQLAEAEVARLRARLGEAERTRERLDQLRDELVVSQERTTMVGQSQALSGVRAQITRVAPSGTTVLIHGETGSGKELVARSIHALSKRSRQAFIPVNCAALPESLIESELFGHERGAFTGADKRRLGKFELADAGTLFLDEIAELPLPAQAKLLRVLQDGAFERVGGAETVKVDVRLIAATHRDLARQVERGRFREDLFYRLNVFRIVVPPLRERKEDLRALIEHLHAQASARMGKAPVPISDRSVRMALSYHWPGNVRELANAVERATLLCDGHELNIEIPESPQGENAPTNPRLGPVTRDILLDLTLEQLQRLQITHALETSGYRVFGPGGAADKLDIHPGTLLSRMDKFGIPRPRAAKRSKRAGTSEPSDEV